MGPSKRHNGGGYWRSLEERAGTPEFQQFLEREFPNLPEVIGTGWPRRRFLQVMGASLGLAGLTACRWPKEQILPAAVRPADRIPGVPNAYATAVEQDGVGTGLLVTSYDGRPIKIEGNNYHPFSRGKTSAWMQATILDLYDPDRSQRPSFNETNRDWNDVEEFLRTHFAPLRENGGARLAVLTEPSSSPSLAAMRRRFHEVFPQATWCAYAPVNPANEIAGTRMAFGAPHRPILHLDQADVVVSLDADLLMRHPAAVRYAGDFAAGRVPREGALNRLYVAEPTLTVTGSLADQRFPVRAADIPAVAERLLHAIGGEASASSGDIAGLDATRFAKLVTDLKSHQGRAVVATGAEQPPVVHHLVALINEHLEAVGKTVTYIREPEDIDAGDATELTRLVDRINAGDVHTLVVIGGNPAYTAPADIDLAAALKGVKTSVYVGSRRNETGSRCVWHIPQAHYLEGWGDVRAWDGTISVVQPLIEPLHGGLTAIEVLAWMTGDEFTRGYDVVRRTFGLKADAPEDAETMWRKSLADGIVAGTTPATVTPKADPAYRRLEPATNEGYEVLLRADYSVHDGRYANNGWMQEWPDPITKLTWDNAACIAPADAKKLGVERSGDLIQIAANGQTLEIPAYILPGQAPGSIYVPLGYGREEAGGVVATGAGRNAYVLCTTTAPSLLTGAKVTRGTGHYELATTQDHHAISSEVGDKAIQERVPELVREWTLADFAASHEHGDEEHEHHPPMQSLWEQRVYDGPHKWGMAIDLTLCTGCGACVTACQAENNVPVVGKDEVAMGREMHWIRVDRYFKGEPEAADVRVAHQPVTCVHCENAPCEQVCPVGATVHDAEGLNVMVYNRCIGTRYCSNNCPFKVRRFNWFYNHHGPAHPRSQHAQVEVLPGLRKHADLTNLEKMQQNPDVTVRSRGVMEKCSYCVQRINRVKIAAKNDGWTGIPDGTITPACGQACPTNAIIFGDLNDPNSRVSQLQQDRRSYALLGELNIRPRTQYLGRVWNPTDGAAAEQHA